MSLLPKLFMFYVGGDVENSNIELHDIRFSVGATPQACYDDLRSQWWGIPKSLHIDSWAEITHADGYNVSVSHTPSAGAEKLYFLNLGGYTENDFEEVHKNTLVVARNQALAIKKSIQAHAHWIQPHKDAIFALEKVISLTEMFSQKGIYLNLEPTDEIQPLRFTSKYIRLNRG